MNHKNEVMEFRAFMLMVLFVTLSIIGAIWGYTTLYRLSIIFVILSKLFYDKYHEINKVN